MTLSIGLSIALASIIAASAWAIDDVLNARRELQIVRSIALAFRNHMTASRCALPDTALSLSAVRAEVMAAGQRYGEVEDESAWRMTFEGGANRQTAVTAFKVDSGAHITRSDTFTLPVPGGDRTHEFFDAVFDSRVCP